MAMTVTSSAALVFEDFEAPFPAWETGWLGTHSDLVNYYGVGTGRGNNPDGLWPAGIAGPNSVDPILVTFAPSVASTISQLSLDVAGYVDTNLRVVDALGTTIYDQPITLTFGAFTDPGTYAHYTIASANGIMSFSFTSPSSSGNTSIDNVEVTIVPEPAAAAVLGALGLVGFAAYRRSRV